MGDSVREALEDLAASMDEDYQGGVFDQYDDEGEEKGDGNSTVLGYIRQLRTILKMAGKKVERSHGGE